MLFVDEAPLTHRIEGTSAFTKAFAASGPLREFDLTRRLFKYPCSYMIYSDAFEGMPAAAKDRIYRRLWDILSGSDKSSKYTRLSEDDRKSVLQVLRNTKKNLPDYWHRA
jgi:hypothetical protein